MERAANKQKRTNSAVLPSSLLWMIFVLSIIFESPPLWAGDADTNSGRDAIFGIHSAAGHIADIDSDHFPPATKRAERRYHSMIVDAGETHDVEPALIKAIIMAESSYNPRAVSSRGAKGLMQIMPITARALGVGADLFDPRNNIDCGVRYFKKLLDRYDGRIELALAAYNAGSAKVKKYRGIPPFKVTRHYIKKVLIYYKYYKKEELA